VVGEFGSDLAQPALRLDLQAVTGLDLQMRGTAAERLGSPAPRELAELRAAGAAGGLRGRANPAGLVGSARHPGRELVPPIAGEDEVGVAVDEAGNDAATGRIEAVVGRNARALDRRDAVALHDERR